jgi:hypothetical protein
MKLSRRAFCQSGSAAFAAALLPGADAFGQANPDPRSAPSEVRAVKLDGSATSIDGAALRELSGSLEGRLLLDGDFGYDGARQIWNGMHDRRPAAIVVARTTADVGHAVTFARERELLLAVKGGGHSWPGHSTADGSLMIDLSALNDVTIDPGARRARVGGGALLYDLDFASLRHGLATTAGIVSHTGVGGLTLGGGYGRLGRKLGLTIDSLLAAELVCADGRVRRLGADENKDLFWAIRGGGGNFGVVTEFEFALHEVPADMYGGVIQWPLAAAQDVLHYYAEHSSRFSKEMFMAPGMMTAPDGSARLAIDICYCGDPRNAERELAPLRAVARPAVDGAAPTSYLTMQTRTDGVARPGIRSYIKSGMIREFTPALIDSLVDGFEPGKGFAVNSFATGGRIAQVDETATAWPHRNAHAMIGVVAFWPDAGLDSARIGAVRSMWSKLEPHVGGYYANIQSGAVEVAGNYGPVYRRLVTIKNAYDPMNLFRLNSNIPPTAS